MTYPNPIQARTELLMSLHQNFQTALRAAGSSPAGGIIAAEMAHWQMVVIGGEHLRERADGLLKAFYKRMPGFVQA